MIRGAAGRRRREYELAAWHAWHVAALGRVRKLPKLDEVVRPRRGRDGGRRQTAAEQQAIAERWQRALSQRR